MAVKNRRFMYRGGLGLALHYLSLNQGVAISSVRLAEAMQARIPGITPSNVNNALMDALRRHRNEIGASPLPNGSTLDRNESGRWTYTGPPVRLPKFLADREAAAEQIVVSAGRSPVRQVELDLVEPVTDPPPPIIVARPPAPAPAPAAECGCNPSELWAFLVEAKDGSVVLKDTTGELWIARRLT